MTRNDKIFIADLYEMGLPLILNHGLILSLFSALFVPGTFQSVIFILAGQLDFSGIRFFSHRIHPSLSSYKPSKHGAEGCQTESQKDVRRPQLPRP